jgi:uridylate kinase
VSDPAVSVRWRRIVFKPSGEALAGPSGSGLDGVTLDHTARSIIDVRQIQDVDVAVVVGGGNFWRGRTGAMEGMDATQSDHIGMLGTVMNALALQDFLEQAGAATRVQSAISMTQVAEPYIPRRAERHLEKGRVVIFGAGAGLPYFSTDTVAAQRALEIGAEEVLVAKNGVDAIYTADPNKHADAERIERVTYSDALQRGLKVVDSTAFSLCMDNNMNMRVFGMEPAGNVTRALLGEPIGTLVTT